MLEKQMPERRLVKRLMNFWEMARAGEPVPSIEKFNGGSLSDVWDFCFTVKLQQRGRGKVYVYEHIGREVVNAYGANPKGEVLSSAIKNIVPGADIVLQIDNCVETMFPAMKYGKFVNNDDNVIKYRSCILPCGRKGEVTHAIIGLSWQKIG